MKSPIIKYGTKVYIMTPWGEIQIGLKYKSLVIWHRGKLHVIKKPNL